MIVLIIVIAVISIGLVASFEEPDKIWFSLRHTNPLLLMMAIVCFLLAWAAEALILHCLIKSHVLPKQKPLQSINLALISKLFDNLTPSSTGGQPFQIWEMKKDGADIGSSIAILAFKFIMFQLLSVGYFVIIIGLNFNSIRLWQTGKILAIVIGLLVNIFSSTLSVMAILKPKTLANITSWIINLLARIKLVANPTAAKRKATTEIGIAHDGFKQIAKHRKSVLTVSLLTFFQLTALFSVAFFLFLPQHPSFNNWFEALSVSCYVWMFSSFIPLPGASIGSESGFILFFSDIFNQQASVTIAMLVWRFVTYYLPIIVGLIYVIQTKKISQLLTPKPKDT